MGTNYYEAVPIGSPGDDIDEPGWRHIGKNSAGWWFLFQGYPEIGLTTWTAWREHLRRGAVLKDDYGRAVEVGEFIGIVERTKDDARRRDPSGWIDFDGWPFIGSEFS